MNTKLHMCHVAALATIILLAATPAFAVEPTHLEPASESDAGVFTLEQSVTWENHDGDEFESETELEYGLNRKLTLGVSVPVEFGGGDGTELGNIGVFLEGIFNPDSPTGPLVGGEIKLLLPTGEDDDGLGGEIQLRISQYFGSDDKHGLHLNLNGYYDSMDDDDHHYWFDDDDSDDEFTGGAALGYSYQVSDATGLVADIFYRDEAGDESEALAELGLKHDFSDVVSGAIGVGVGLNDDSPDAIVKAGIEFKFGSGGKN